MGEIGLYRGAVRELVGMLSTQQEKGKKGKKGDEAVSGAALCLENAAGLLLQLTVCERNVSEMVKEGCIPLLVGLLKAKGSSLAVVQYSTCILASLGLDERHHEQLLEAGSPPYLIKASAPPEED